MSKIEKAKNHNGETIFPVTVADAVLMGNGQTLKGKLSELGSKVEKNNEYITFAKGEEVVVSNWTSGAINTNASVGDVVELTVAGGTGATYKHQIISVSEDCKIIVKGLGGGSFHLWSFIDASNKLISKDSYSTEVHSVELIAPKGADKLVVNVRIEYEFDDVKLSVKSIDNRLKSLNEGIVKLENLNVLMDSECKYGEWKLGGIATYGDNGKVFELTVAGGTGATYIHQIIPAVENNRVHIKGNASIGSILLWSFFDNDNVKLSGDTYHTELQDIIVIAPKNTSKIVVNVKVADEYDDVTVFNDGIIKRVESLEGKLDGVGYEWKGKTLLAIGDSITANSNTKWQYHVGDILSMSVRTHAKGGIGILKMVDGDGSAAPPNYDPDTDASGNIYPLSSKDVKGVDVIICHGFYNEVRTPLGTISDMYNPSDLTGKTLCGLLNYMIKRIYQCIEDAGNYSCKIILSSPHRFGKYPYSDNDGYYIGDEFADTIKKIAEHNSIGYIDTMHYSNINKYNWNCFQASSTPYNPLYITGDGSNNDGRNKPFASFGDLPTNVPIGSLATVGVDSFTFNGTIWESNGMSAPWNGDQLHTNESGSKRIGEYVAGCLKAMLPDT